MNDQSTNVFELHTLYEAQTVIYLYRSISQNYQQLYVMP